MYDIHIINHDRGKPPGSKTMYHGESPNLTIYHGLTAQNQKNPVF